MNFCEKIKDILLRYFRESKSNEILSSIQCYKKVNASYSFVIDYC